jgi:ribosome-associated protein
MRFLVVSTHLKIPLEEFCISYSRSSGPGGQNVNKVSSKVTVRWAVAQSPSLPIDLRQSVVTYFGNRLTTSGDLLVTSQRFRDASKNLSDCLAKLRLLIAAAVRPPKVRRPTRPSRGSVARRLEQKRLRADKKGARRPEPWS